MPGQSPAGQAPTKRSGLSPPFGRGQPGWGDLGGECPGNRLQGRLLRGAWGFPVFVGASPAREVLGNARAIACRAGSYEGRGASPAFRRSEPCSRGFGECPGNRLQGRLLRGAWGFPVLVGASPAREILGCRSRSCLRSP